MNRLIIILSIFFGSFQQQVCASVKEVANVPDSVYLLAYATVQDDGRSGLRFAWSADQESWFDIGKGYGYVRCDYGRWGSQKKMLDPCLKLKPNGEWVCTWKLNAEDGYGQASSQNLTYWGRQTYPRETSDFTGQRVNALIGSESQTGTVNKVTWALVDGLIKSYEAAQYRNSLYDERLLDDDSRFAGLKPVKATVTAQPGQTKAISDLLMGIFFEDINYAADGGLYAELIQNRDFEYVPSDRGGDQNWNSTHSWTLKGDHASFTIDTVAPIHPNNPHYAVLKIEQPGAVLTNTGFDEIALHANGKYDFSVFARVQDGKSQKIRVRLVAADGTVQGETMITVSSRSWKIYRSVLTAKTSADAHLELQLQNAGELNLDMVSLFPQNTFKGRKNGLRPDLAQTLADMHPRFIRFPGGCVAHGDGLHNIYRWKNTIGPLEARKPARNLWGYHQSMGLGYLEYFQFCEDVGAEPLPVLAAGVPCQNSGHNGHELRGGQQGGIPMCEMGAYVQDILDLIEWANGDAKKTKWGKIRAESGHPKPFNLKYIGIGNEDLITDVFEERFTMIFQAIKEKYPEMIVIGTVGPFFEGTDYEEGWKLADKLNIPMVDEHYYLSPGWFLHNQDFYDKYDRTKAKVYLGEYASHIPGRKVNMETALSEALYLASLERNGDIVHMTSYAPLLAKEKHTQWNPDLIYFNNREVKPTTGYYVQQLYGEHAGDRYIPSQVKLDNQDERVKLRVASSIVCDSKTGDVIVKLVNLLPVSVDMDVQLPEIAGIQPSAGRTLLTGTPESTPVPVRDTIEVGETFTQKLPAYSFTVIRIKTK